jgi:uncharacterized protein
MYPRRLARRVETALADTRVVLIVGPRQAGKTTLARQFAADGRPFLSLDDLPTLHAAQADPVGFVRGLERAVIDEVQRAPDLLLAIKESVDRDEAPGRFLLTGSANLMTLPTVADSLAGRIAILPLFPLAQAELRAAPGRMLDRLFAGERPDFMADPVFGGDLVAAVLAGGYPEAVRRTSIARRQAWLADYAALVIDRDIREIARLDQIEHMPRLLSVLAEHAGQLVNHASYGAALGMNRITAQKYLQVLERLFLLRMLASWSSNRLSRLVKTAKVQFLDSGLLAALRDVDAAQIGRDRALLGPLLETFVFAELLKLASWSESRVTITHFRTKDRDEVDFVLEDRRGRVVGVAVKAAATIGARDFTGLRKLQETTGDRFVLGLVLHDHDRTTPFGERLFAAPVSALWAM